MIKFFRKIRYDLLTKNKTGKYLKYAIGEIVLVVIGILIALSLNNWKEDLANQGEERRILGGLKQEFEVNLAEVMRNIELNKPTLESTAIFIDLIRKEKPFENYRRIDSLLYSLYWFGSFDAQTGLIDEVINSGKLSVIKDKHLRDRLTSISGILDNSEEDYKNRSDFYFAHVIPYLSKYFPLVNMDQYIDYSSWSDTYNIEKISESPFTAKYGEVDLLQLENLIYQHKINSDFVLLNEYEMRNFFKETLTLINSNLHPNK